MKPSGAFHEINEIGKKHRHTQKPKFTDEFGGHRPPVIQVHFYVNQIHYRFHYRATASDDSELLEADTEAEGIFKIQVGPFQTREIHQRGQILAIDRKIRSRRVIAEIHGSEEDQ